MFKKISWIASVLFLTLSISFAHAQTPATDQTVLELMKVTGASEMGKQMMQQMMPSLKKMTPQVPESFWTDFMKEVNPDQMTALVVPIYKKHFTEEDLRQIIQFYNSPVGKKTIQQMPQIMQESIAVGQQWGQELGKKVIEKASKVK